MTDILSKEQTSCMKPSLDQLIAWSKTNHLNINVKKTKTMSLLNVPVDQDLLIDDVPIESVASYKLLGVHIDADLKWNSHIDDICNKRTLSERAELKPTDAFEDQFSGNLHLFTYRK